MEYSNSEASDNGPKICSKCQQFYGTKETGFMCSKCFKEGSLKLQKGEDQYSMIKKNSVTQNSLNEFEFVKSEQLSKLLDVQEINDVDMQSEEEQKSKHSNELSTSTQKSNEEDKTKKQKNRCNMCNKKTGLLGFECKCGFSFCSKHRHGDDHNCQYDYRNENREKLEKQNPIVSHSKIGRI